MKEALNNARSNRPGTAQTETSVQLSKYSVASSRNSEYSSSSRDTNDDDDDDDDDDDEKFVPGQIIGKNPVELLQDFWFAYPGFERHHANLAKDGFDDLEALMVIFF